MDRKKLHKDNTGMTLLEVIVAVSIFSMTGGSTSYSAPDAGSTVYGTDNIFGTIENTKKSKKSKKKAAETVTADTGAQQNQEAGQTPTDETTDSTQSAETAAQ